MGLDRVDSLGDNTIFNTQPCFALCIFVKGDFGLDFAILKARQVAEYTNSVEVPNEDPLRIQGPMGERQPIFWTLPLALCGYPQQTGRMEVLRRNVVVMLGLHPGRTVTARDSDPTT